MNKVFINATNVTPEITFDKRVGNLGFNGRSYPENPKNFYKVIHMLVDQLKMCKSQTISLYLNLDFFNAGSAKCIYRVMKMMGEMKYLGKRINLNWYYEADDQCMREIGEDFASSLDLDINFVPCLKSDTIMDNFIKL